MSVQSPQAGGSGGAELPAPADPGPLQPGVPMSGDSCVPAPAGQGADEDDDGPAEKEREKLPPIRPAAGSAAGVGAGLLRLVASRSAWCQVLSEPPCG